MAMQTDLRRLLGDHRYRVITQFIRTWRIILHPKFEEETKFLARWVTPGAVCLDIGANYGQYARVLSRLAGKQGHVYAFEPSRVTADCLRLTARLLRLPSVTVVQAALGEEAGSLTLNIPIKPNGGLGISLAHFGADADRACLSETVEVRTLDAFVAENNLTRCDFIKCDVEGAEFLVLQGASATLERFHPVVLMEINSRMLERNGHTVAQIEDAFRARGYRFFALENGALAEHPGIVDRTNNFFLPPDISKIDTI